ncbi:MAG: hypothetical protein WC986_15040 [Elusimicrobiota bacterium]|jgi:hypothetical protein
MFRLSLVILLVSVSARSWTDLAGLPWWARLCITFLVGGLAGATLAWFARDEYERGRDQERARWVEREAKVVNLSEWLARTMKPGSRQ